MRATCGSEPATSMAATAGDASGSRARPEWSASRAVRGSPFTADDARWAEGRLTSRVQRIGALSEGCARHSDGERAANARNALRASRFLRALEQTENQRETTPNRRAAAAARTVEDSGSNSGAIPIPWFVTSRWILADGREGDRDCDPGPSIRAFVSKFANLADNAPRRIRPRWRVRASIRTRCYLLGQRAGAPARSQERRRHASLRSVRIPRVMPRYTSRSSTSEPCAALAVDDMVLAGHQARARIL